ncbi:hypothetical protein BD410DRAFT_810030 [Rickenella mellea]|uniref:F-box domain-containing protein n=1 Tax=Rickenella mellea TaxID=50990 RepID=A0A4Y7PFT7_9AGAM|nr:hypothetical protein BD410DRAFT_810030 [Rickenella mellea]
MAGPKHDLGLIRDADRAIRWERVTKLALPLALNRHVLLYLTCIIGQRHCLIASVCVIRGLQRNKAQLRPLIELGSFSFRGRTSPPDSGYPTTRTPHMGSLLSTQSLKRKAEDDVDSDRPNKRCNNHACANCGAQILLLSHEDNRHAHHVRRVIPADILLAITHRMDPCDRVRDLRSLACASRHFSRLFVQEYLEEAGFEVLGPGNVLGGAVTLSDVYTCDALSVWHRSHLFRPLRRLELRMPQNLSTATHMLRTFCDFLRSLPPNFSGITQLHLVINGPERMQLRRLLNYIHRCGVRQLTLESCPDFLVEPVYDTAKARENTSIETLEFSGIFPYYQILPWSRTMCSQPNIRTLHLTLANVPTGKWAALLVGLKIHRLVDFQVDLSISFKILIDFASMNETIQYLTVLQGDNPSRIMDLTPGLAKKTDMPYLLCLEGPATFQLAFLNHMSAPLDCMLRMVVHSDGKALDPWTLTKVLARAPRISKLTVHFPASTNGASFADMSWPRVESLLTGISSLVVYDNAGELLGIEAQNMVMTNLVKWIGLFPSLYKLELHYRGRADYMKNLTSYTRLAEENICISYY